MASGGISGGVGGSFGAINIAGSNEDNQRWLQLLRLKQQLDAMIANIKGADSRMFLREMAISADDAASQGKVGVAINILQSAIDSAKDILKSEAPGEKSAQERHRHHRHGAGFGEDTNDVNADVAEAVRKKHNGIEDYPVDNERALLARLVVPPSPAVGN